MSSKNLLSTLLRVARSGSSSQAVAAGAVGGAQQSSGDKFSWSGLAFGGAAAVAGLASVSTAFASGSEADDGLHAPHYHWNHDGMLGAFDHMAIRRGHQVYKQVCAACHSMEYIHFRDLVGVCYTEAEAKALAAEYEYVDGPDETGSMFDRPGKLADTFPSPYKNENEGSFANGGAYPPDLSLMTRARHDGNNYVFALLTGYRDPPPGITVRQGLYYNPYFPGGVISMPKMLTNEAVEYDDGTPATESQMAKDVTTFLAWAAAPEHDERKLLGLKILSALVVALVTTVYWKRWMWAPLKTRKLVLDVVN